MTNKDRLMSNYILQKDFITAGIYFNGIVKAGAIFTPYINGTYKEESGLVFREDFVENNTDWFKKEAEQQREYTKDDMRKCFYASKRYAFHYLTQGSNSFPFEEKTFEDYLKSIE